MKNEDWNNIFSIITESTNYNYDNAVTIISDIVAKIYNGKYVCSDPEKDSWLVYHDQNQKLEDNSLSLRNKISTELPLYFIRAEKEYREIVIDAVGYDIPGQLQIKIRQMQEIPNLLKKNNFVDDIIKECQQKMKKVEPENSSFWSWMIKKIY